MSVANVFCEARSNAVYGKEKLLELGFKPSGWIDYTGDEVPWFEVFMRWGSDHSVVANINSSEQGAGRLPIILSALKPYGYIIFENVLNKRLYDRLIREGFEPHEGNSLIGFHRAIQTIE